MRARHVLAFAVSFGLAAAVLAQASGEAKAKSASEAGRSRAAVIMPTGDLKWTDIDPVRSPGVKITDLWGNHTTGAYGAFIKFPAGFSAPLHTHTNDARLAIVSGTFVHGPEGKPEVRLGPGSYLMQPGNYRHTTRCEGPAECVFLTQSTGKFDLLPVDGGTAPPK